MDSKDYQGLKLLKEKNQKAYEKSLENYFNFLNEESWAIPCPFCGHDVQVRHVERRSGVWEKGSCSHCQIDYSRAPGALEGYWSRDGYKIDHRQGIEKVRRRVRDALNKTADASKIMKAAELFGVKLD